MASISIPAFITEAATAISTAAEAGSVAVADAATAAAASAGATLGPTTAGIIGDTAVNAVVGAGLGAGTAALTGGDPLKGAAIGGAGAGLLTAGAGALGAGGAGAAAPGAGTTSAQSMAAPTGIDAAAPGTLPGYTAANLNLQSVDTSNLVAGATSAAPNAGGAPLPSLTGVGTGAASGAPTQTAGIPNTNLIGAHAPGDPAATAAPVSPASPVAPATATDAFAGIETANPGYFSTFSTPPGEMQNFTGVGGNIVAPGGGADTASGWDTALKYAPAGVGVLGLGANFLMSQQQPPGYGALASEASALRGEGAQLRSDALSGTLPPGMHEALQRAAGDAETQIRANYAHSGQSGSSAEAQDVANLKMRVQAQGAEIAKSLLASGVEESQLSASIYEQLMQTAIAQDQALATGIGNFATALASMGRPVYQIGTPV